MWFLLGTVSVQPKPTVSNVQPQVIKIPSPDGSGPPQTVKVVPGQTLQGQPQVIKVYSTGADGQQKLIHVVQPGLWSVRIIIQEKVYNKQ